MNHAALLALIADLYAGTAALEAEVTRLRAEIERLTGADQ